MWLRALKSLKETVSVSHQSYDSSLLNGLDLWQSVMRTTGWKQRAAASMFGISLAAGGIVQPAQHRLKIGDVVWASCSDNGTLPGAECGFAIVPLDYENPNAGVVKIALGRFNATSSNRLGSVILNPGGPGGPGVGLATVRGAEFHHLLGEEYDIIGFDPRGIGLTEPATKCFPEPGSRTAFISNTIIDRGYDVGSNLTDPFNRFHLIQTQRDADALYKTQFEICKETMGEQLKYMGTTFVVQDINYLTTLLEGEEALINFYGLSYGTIMGQYLVNMFPDRVGRVAIDGVIDANVWSSLPPYEWLRYFSTSTDSTYRVFAKDCADAGPTRCALSKSEKDTPEDVYNRLEAFINGLYEEPLPVPDASVPGILTIGRVRMYLIESLAAPDNWPLLAEALDQAMQGNGTTVINTLANKSLVDLERSAVSCNDVKPFAPGPTPEEIIDVGLNITQDVSMFYFATTIAEPDYGCQFWPFEPPQRFAGPWNHTLRNPILIISNTYDPATSIGGGESVHKALGNSSALLVQDGPGHTSIRFCSSCTIAARRAFFANGTLPKEGTVCPVDGTPFPAPGVAYSNGAADDGLCNSLRLVSEHVFDRR